jgi:hypothetical protein
LLPRCLYCCRNFVLKCATHLELGRLKEVVSQLKTGDKTRRPQGDERFRKEGQPQLLDVTMYL